MRSILDLETKRAQSQSPSNRRAQEAETNAGVSESVAALGTRLNELREADSRAGMKRPESVHVDSSERRGKMAREAQHAPAATAAADGDLSGAGTPNAPVSPSSAAKRTSEPHSDYELVLGRGQIASCLFAGTVVVAIFAGGAYFAGKLSAVNCVAASNAIPSATAPLRVPSVVSQAATPSGATPFMTDDIKPAPENTITANAAAPAVKAPSGAPAVVTSADLHNASAAQANAPVSVDAKGSPLFANPQPGALYLQVAAVEKGMATVIAEGLRQHGLASLVAPGPTDKVFRVLVGPFANQEEYKRVKTQIDSIDVGNFARQFEK